MIRQTVVRPIIAMHQCLTYARHRRDSDGAERMEEHVSVMEATTQTDARSPLVPMDRGSRSITATPGREPVVFTADSASEPDHLTQRPNAAFLAELAAHRSAETPFCIGLFGPAGSGKSSFLNALLGSVGDMTAAAAESGNAGPFLPHIATVRIEADPGETPATSILHQVMRGLGEFPSSAGRRCKSRRKRPACRRPCGRRAPERGASASRRGTPRA